MLIILKVLSVICFFNEEYFILIPWKERNRIYIEKIMIYLDVQLNNYTLIQKLGLFFI